MHETRMVNSVSKCFLQARGKCALKNTLIYRFFTADLPFHQFCSLNTVNTGFNREVKVQVKLQIMKRLEIVKRLICEKENSQIIPLNSRSSFQRVKLSRIYELLALLRILLTLYVQTGWIHQDEFTNSMEVVAGDYFNLKVFKSPAFNATFPTRSIFFLHCTVYFPYLLTSHHFINTVHPLGKELHPNSQLLILIPRLLYVSLSFIVDFVLLSFCKMQSKRHYQNMNLKARCASAGDGGQESQDDDDEQKVSSSTDSEADDPHNDHSIRLVALASSQILLIFASRTHSSSLNLIFYSILLYLVSSSMYTMEDYLPILDKYNGIDARSDPIRKIKTGRDLKAIGYSPIQHLHWIALIIVAGIFNDPDFFLSYGAVPIFFYLQRGISHPHIGMTHFHARLFGFLTYFFAFCIPFILWDSFYYGRVSLDDIYNLNLSVTSFVVTPANYFAGKMSYGRDLPTLVRAMVNYLFLFNIIGVMGLTSVLAELYDVTNKDWKDKPKLDSQWIFLNCSWFLPLILLIQYKSSFDLVPLIFPLVYMHGHKIPLLSRFSSKIGQCWFICNLIGLMYWGYSSQAGILRSFMDLSNNLLPSRYNNTHVDIILSQITAIPPTFVLALPLQWKTILNVLHNPSSSSFSTSSSTPFNPETFWAQRQLDETPRIILQLESDPKIRVLHTGNSPLPLYLLENELVRLVNTKTVGQYDVKINFLLLPSNLRGDVQAGFQKLRMSLVKTYWNHLLVDWTITNDHSPSTGDESRIGLDENVITRTKRRLRTIVNYKYNLPNITYGLDLYRFEPMSSTTTNTNININTNSEQVFRELFNWDHDESDFLAWFCQGFVIAMTMFLFIMSYVTFTL